MNLTSPTQVRRLLEELNIRPSKVLGQNFLIDGNILDILLDTADLQSTDQVLEIGPGLGVLTEAMSERVSRVVAIEKDKRLFEYLQREHGDRSNLELVHSDVMHVDLDALLASGLDKMVSNLPYGVGTRALVDLIASTYRPCTMVVTVQFDVAERFVAEPHSKAYGLVSVLSQTRYRVAVRKKISPRCFYPRPQVDSAILQFESLAATAGPSDWDHFLALTKWAFGQRRKQMGHILQKAPDTLVRDGGLVEKTLSAIGLASSARPEEVSPHGWCDLSDALVRRPN